MTIWGNLQPTEESPKKIKMMDVVMHYPSFPQGCPCAHPVRDGLYGQLTCVRDLAT